MPRKSATTAAHIRFTQLRALFHQAPLPKKEFDELVELSAKFNRPMHDYLVQNKSLFV